MIQHEPSPSALKVAALRALHQTAEIPPIFVDPLATRLLGPDSDALIATARASAKQTARLRGTLAVRAVVAEEAVAAAVARGVRQCVILGAGLDTFPYRHTHPGLVVFEVDQAATQTWKRGLLRSAAIAEPAGVRYVTVNFERDDLFDALTAAGFETGHPAIFVMLGVTPYLPPATSLALFATIRTQATTGSEVVFDYTEPYDTAPTDVRAGYEAAAARVGAAGEPWVALFDPADLHGALREMGFTEIGDIDAQALHQRFCADRTDGLTVAALVHLLRAGF